MSNQIMFYVFSVIIFSINEPNFVSYSKVSKSEQGCPELGWAPGKTFFKCLPLPPSSQCHHQHDSMHAAPILLSTLAIHLVATYVSAGQGPSKA